MKIKVIIFSYERKSMLLSLLDEVKDYDYMIIDDGSSFILDHNFYQFEHGGKPKFWRMWDYALRSLKNDNSDIFLFIPSDVSNVNFNDIIKRHKQFSFHPYAYNVINDGRLNCWNTIKPVRMDDNTNRVGFTDCGFFCNKATLNKIGYYVNEVNPRRFLHNTEISSGVGQQLTQRMRRNGIYMYMPAKSIVTHGSHPSLMHPEERLKTPLISR